ncbi:MAG: Gfo/Idh/MocA family oxidoreductase [Candidatus Hydrogenedentes bacterium]|nr:Gfo/Idh/MocA family oxidoreductase [Candidatus Hydrogenedentota bacterium]
MATARTRRRKSRSPIRGKVRLALIGAGGMANGVHYPSLSEMADVDMAALCDLVPDKAQATAKRFGIPKVYSDYRKMLDEVRPHAVYALMPPHHIHDVAVEVLNRKHHLFIEKPPGVNAYQNRQLALHAKRNGVIAMAAFQRRYVPIINQLKKRVEAHGPIHTVEVNFIKFAPDPVNYYGGAIDILSCDAVHAVDTLRYLCGGDVLSVASSVRALDADSPNSFYALVTFSSGVTGILKTNWACGHRVFSVEMHTTGMSAYAEPDVSGAIYKDGSTEPEPYDPAGCAKSDATWHKLGFFGENRHFIDCVKSGKQPCSNIEDTVATMELVDRIYHNVIPGA